MYINKRNRYIYAILISIVILLGLASRKFSISMPNFVVYYIPDTLWGLMVFFIMGFLFNKFKTSKVVVYSLVFAYLIEISQLYHVPWLDQIRSTKLGGLI
ncbi:ribosomal maturation YjgA family protein [Tepidibacter formicigenes]|jgi:hypothetical protein|uniref:Uncharacterized protein n=1 Tax=Tepidibacter formicigenes DSM 15518 TaxID=1123349 RepID=A0A1M6R8N7_9FIRM|nr:DUF2809 domain-containing protein [Tepidibacter formicigenes]SHK28822.1 Protein of unknown function [Tepidibacter formicigenes DSM 15518]